MSLLPFTESVWIRSISPYSSYKLTVTKLNYRSGTRIVAVICSETATRTNLSLNTHPAARTKNPALCHKPLLMITVA